MTAVAFRNEHDGRSDPRPGNRGTTAEGVVVTYGPLCGYGVEIVHRTEERRELAVAARPGGWPTLEELAAHAYEVSPGWETSIRAICRELRAARPELP